MSNFGVSWELSVQMKNIQMDIEWFWRSFWFLFCFMSSKSFLYKRTRKKKPPNYSDFKNTHFCNWQLLFKTFSLSLKTPKTYFKNSKSKCLTKSTINLCQNQLDSRAQKSGPTNVVAANPKQPKWLQFNLHQFEYDAGISVAQMYVKKICFHI